MKIYLIRHGIAELKAIDKPDADRMLAKRGIVKIQKIAQKLSRLDIKFDVIITSPYRRAQETAIILKQAALSEQIIEHSALKPEGNILEWINSIQEQNYPIDTNICLVGHQPNLTDWTELLVWGKIQNRLSLKKAGIIGIELLNSSNPIGTCELFLLTSPKWMIN